ncbi:MAG: glycogen/starch synthase [Chitinophagales bacterium]
MSNKKKVLIVTQEMLPYLPESSIAKASRTLPEYLKTKGKMELRILTPRFGTVNERRHRLHEVVRLSGINIIIDEDDYPLIIKVASLPQARMQVYFLDNEDFFKRKFVFNDKNGKFYKDNVERMVFFCKGVIETVKKFGWAPDVIHCHGWMTSLIPLYIRTAYKNDALFTNSKIVYTAYENSFTESFGDIFKQKAMIKKVSDKDIAPYMDLNNNGLHKGAIYYSDGVVKGDAVLDEEIEKVLQNGVAENKHILDYSEDEEFKEAHKKFYAQLLEEE